MSNDPHQRGDRPGHDTPAAPLPATPPGFTGTIRRHDPEGGTFARLSYANGRVVAVAVHDATTGRLITRAEGDDGGLATLATVTRFTWSRGDVTITLPESGTTEDGAR